MKSNMRKCFPAVNHLNLWNSIVVQMIFVKCTACWYMQQQKAKVISAALSSVLPSSVIEAPSMAFSDISLTPSYFKNEYYSFYPASLPFVSGFKTIKSYISGAVISKGKIQKLISVKEIMHQMVSNQRKPGQILQFSWCPASRIT